LAYSTVSQLGFMFLAVGGGAYIAGMLHLTAHAFFKALLFLGAGSVMHAMAHGFEHAGDEPDPLDGLPADQDMRNMGGLLRRLKITGPTFLVGGLALAGLFPFVGFFSKDEILLETLAHGSGGVDFWSVMWAIAMFGALVTAFYSGRGLLLVLSGEPRSEGARMAEESPLTMTLPLLLLALLTVFGGLLALRIAGREPAVESLLEPVVAHPEAVSDPSKLVMAILATAVTLVGLLAAWLLYGRRVVAPERLAGRLPLAYKTAYRAFYVDEIYMALIVRPFRALADFLWHVVDDQIIDGAVNGVGRATGSVGQWSRRLQTGYVRTYVLAMLFGAVLIVVYLLLVAR
jgi:NADH-quinone oxidoreductase subunit L